MIYLRRKIMMIRELIEKNRTYRRFYQDVEVSRETLRGLIDLARLSSTGGNLQSLKYVLSQTLETNKKIFKTLKWAGYLLSLIHISEPTRLGMISYAVFCLKKKKKTKK